MTSLKWTRKTLKKISDALKPAGVLVSPNTVARLLKKMDYRLRVNHKKISGSKNPERDHQFRRIERTRRNFEKEKLPVISVDAKKKELVDPFGLSVTVCHYPPKTSKWNPIEHRLFSEISKNWRGQPLLSYETVLNSIRTTTTKTGLFVKATLMAKDYPTGIKIPEDAMKKLNLQSHNVLPQWNYTLHPRQIKM